MDKLGKRRTATDSKSHAPQIIGDAHLADVEIVCAGEERRSFRCNRTTLAATSKFFKLLFEWPRADESGSGDVYVVDNVEPDIFHRFLCLAATTDVGTQLINEDNVLTVLAAAVYFGADKVEQVCCASILANLVRADYVMLLTFAEEHACHHLAETIRTHILRCGTAFFAAGDHLLMTAKQLRDILESDELRVDREEDVWNGLVGWYSHLPTVRLETFGHLLELVRFGVLEKSSLDHLVVPSTLDQITSFLLHQELAEVREMHFSDPHRSYELKHPRHRLRQFSFVQGMVLTGAATCYYSDGDPHTVLFLNPLSGMLMKLKRTPMDKKTRRQLHPLNVVHCARQDKLYMLTAKCSPKYWQFGPIVRTLCSKPLNQRVLYCYDPQDDMWTKEGPIFSRPHLNNDPVGLFIVDTTIYTVHPRPATIVTYSLTSSTYEEFPLPFHNTLTPPVLVGHVIYLFHCTVSPPPHPPPVDSFWSSSTFMFDTTSKQCVQKSPSFSKKYKGYTCLHSSGLIYCLTTIGGNPFDSNCNLESYDPVRDTWRALRDAPLSGLVNPGIMMSYGNRILAVGHGGREERQSFTMDVVLYDPQTDTWTDHLMLAEGADTFTDSGLFGPGPSTAALRIRHDALSEAVRKRDPQASEELLAYLDQVYAE